MGYRRLSDEDTAYIMRECEQAGLNGPGKFLVLCEARNCTDETAWIDQIVMLRDVTWKTEDGSPPDPWKYKTRHEGRVRPDTSDYGKAHAAGA